LSWRRKYPRVVRLLGGRNSTERCCRTYLIATIVCWFLLSAIVWMGCGDILGTVRSVAIGDDGTPLGDCSTPGFWDHSCPWPDTSCVSMPVSWHKDYFGNNLTLGFCIRANTSLDRDLPLLLVGERGTAGSAEPIPIATNGLNNVSSSSNVGSGTTGAEIMVNRTFCLHETAHGSQSGESHAGDEAVWELMMAQWQDDETGYKGLICWDKSVNGTNDWVRPSPLPPPPTCARQLLPRSPCPCSHTHNIRR